MGELCDALEIAVCSDVYSSGEGLLDMHRRADEVLLQKHVIRELEQAISVMPSVEKHFVRRCCFDGKTLREAGEEIGVSCSWSSRIYARAKERLREIMSRWLE